MTPTLNIRLLGEFSLAYDGAPITGVNTPRLQSLLTYLLLHRDAPQSRAHLAFQFWPDSTEAQARGNLRTLLHRLRRALPDALPDDVPYLDVDAQTIQWHPDAPTSIDVAAFQDALAQASTAEEAGDQVTARQALERAATLYTGDLLPSCYDDWILPHRERLRQAHLRALERLIRLLEDRREYDTAIAHAQRILRLDPLHEAATRRLMHLHALKGDRTGALRAYHACATTLQRELGVEPSPATQRAYERLLSVETRPEPTPSPAAGLIPLVGREEEWAQLQTAWRRAARGPHFVLILGEAGIGKTRLVEELLHWAARQNIDHAYARCYAAEGDLAYAPVAALLRASPLPPLDEVWLSEVARLLPEVLTEHPDLPPPQPMAEAWRRWRLFEALAHAMLDTGLPILLVVDDLQWCSRESLEWLHFLLRFDPRAPLLVVGTCRPEELDEDCPLTQALPTLHRDVRLRELELGPLNEAQTATLASNVADGPLEATETRRLYQETEGNPLFIVETLRSGLLAREERPGRDDLTLPPRVQAVFTARLVQLSPQARELVGLAATIGRQFAVPLLQQAGDADEEGLARGLDELWQRRIVRERDLEAYDFSHDKLREAAYGALSPARRRLLHHRVAQALEAIHAHHLDPVSRQVAAHYHRAGLPAQAIPYYLRAGELAKGLCAQDEANACFECGLVLLEEGAWDPSTEAWCSQMAARFYEGLGDVLAQSAQPGEAKAAYGRALKTVESDDLLAHSRLHRKVYATLWPQGEYQEALKALGQAEAALGAPPLEPNGGWTGAQTAWWVEWGQVQLARGMVQYYAAQVNAMTETVYKLAQGVERCRLPLLRLFQWTVSTLMSHRRDRYIVSAEAVAEGTSFLAHVTAGEDLDRAASAEYGWGWLLLLHGDLDGAEEHLQAGLMLTKRTGNLVHQTWLLTWLSVLHRKRGEAEATRAYAIRGLQAAADAQLLENGGLARGNLAWFAWREGNLAEAEKQGHAALELWQRSPFVYAFHWTARFPLLAVALTREQLPEALDHARALLDPQQQKLPETLEAALEAAVQAADDEEDKVVRQRLEQTIQVARETGYL
jgi:DNA-binding SARP family transcriptional activator/predicted ATPase